MQQLRPPRLDDINPAGLLAYFEQSWALCELLFGAVDDSQIHAQPDPLRQPLIFYIGHAAAFYVNKLRMVGLLDAGVSPRLDELLAKGVDPATAGDLERRDDWPSLAEVLAYRREVHGRVREIIRAIEPGGPVTPSDPLWAVLMAIEHDRIHFETSSVLIRQLPVDAVTRPEAWVYAPHEGRAPRRRFVEIPTRTVIHGRDLTTGLYGWDNEFGRQTLRVPGFETSACLVSKQELLEFWRDGGYDDARLWSDDGWAWRRRVGQEHPKFWRIDDGEPRYRAMFDELELPLAWPAEVNAHEAAAVCRWIGGVRLPTEAEFLALSADAPTRAGDVLGVDAYNLELRYGSPRAVDERSSASERTGIHDPFGNVWQWLADDFAPLPGFEPHPLYLDFSAPYFDDQHAAMRGGSWATTGTAASRHYRLWFRRHFYQHAGFRLVRSVAN